MKLLNSNYTTPLFNQMVEIIHKNTGESIASILEKDIDVIIQEARPYIFNFAYDIFSDDYKNDLERHFLLYFAQREIASTWDIFLLELREKFRINLPYYNKLYDSTGWMEKYDISPVYNTDVKEEFSRKNTGTQVYDAEGTNQNTINSNGQASTTTQATDTSRGTSDSTSTSSQSSNSKQYMTDTAQGDITEGDEEINPNYASSVNRGDNDSTQESIGNGTTTTNGESNSTISGTNSDTSTSNATNNNTNTRTDNLDETYESRRYGNIGVQTFADIIMSNREAFLNVDILFFNNVMEDLFFQLY